MNSALIDNIRSQIQPWKERFEALTIRERALVTAASAAVLFVIWNILFLTPIEKNMQVTSTQLESLSNQLTELDTQIEAMAGSKAQESEIVKEIAQVQGQLEQLRKKQNNLMGEFINPSTMVRVLKDLLKENGLTLVRMESSPAKSLFATEKEEEGKSTQQTTTKSNTPNIFMHSVTLELEGDYFTTLKYLHALEDQPWRFYWDQIEYRVSTYPKARITIVLYTLSLEEGWIGV